MPSILTVMFFTVFIESLLSNSVLGSGVLLVLMVKSSFIRGYGPEIIIIVTLLSIAGLYCSSWWRYELFGHPVWAHITIKNDEHPVPIQVSAGADEWLVDLRLKLLFCPIPKNSMSQWYKLFFEITGRIDREAMSRPYPEFDAMYALGEACAASKEPSTCNWPQGALKLAALDPAWTRIVVVRDPVERLVSAWLDKCAKVSRVQGRLKKRRPKFCNDKSSPDFQTKPTPEASLQLTLVTQTSKPYCVWRHSHDGSECSTRRCGG